MLTKVQTGEQTSHLITEHSTNNWQFNEMGSANLIHCPDYMIMVLKTKSTVWIYKQELQLP